MSKNITFLINQSEITAGTRGASLGPDAILSVARHKGSTIFGEHEVQRLPNVNHFLDRPTNFPFAKRIDGLIDIYTELNDRVSNILKKDAFPFVIAADHGSAGGTIAGIKSAFPDKRLGVIWIDAHADIHTPYTTPTGNMHGMPLASALDLDNIECKVNEIDEETASHWKKLRAIGGISPKIKADDLIYIAVRDTEEQEDCLIEQLQIQNITVNEVREKGAAAIAKIAEDKLSGCDLLYVSFDVDSMDPDLISYGTGTSVKNGLSAEEATEILRLFAKNPKVICVELVEVNPCLDDKINKMAETALDIIEAVTSSLKR